jgi:hypothetical protein
MKITRIDVEGQSGATASIERKGAAIEATIGAVRHGRFGARRHFRTLTASLASPDEQRSLVAALQQALDGSRGTSSMVQDYRRLIEQLAG